MKDLKSTLLLYVKGVAMGAADVVPGVSGGTVAFISGIYEELLNSIKSVNAETLKLLLTAKFSAFWKAINGNFLVVLLAGIATSFLSLAKLIKYGLEHHPQFIWAYFFGLIISSAVLVAKDIQRWDYKTLIGLVVGIVAAAIITNSTPASTPDALWFVFLAGSISICAMILPGISGAFILLLLGKYEFILEAFSKLDILTLATFSAGAAVGLIAFSNLLSWLLNNYRFIMIAVLSGFMLGSLGVVWPWKKPIYKLSEGGHELFTHSGKPIVLGYEHYLPSSLTGEVYLSIGLFIVGLVTIFGIERLAKKISQEQPDRVEL